jgi:protein translocase SecG subunit
MDVGNIRTVFTVLVFLSALGIIISYLFQSPKATGLGAISGNATVFKSRKPIDAFLDKVIITSAIVFGISVFILAILKQS